MSEYQYYEFQAIDRPLNKPAQKNLRDLSSRAQITATSFTNTYQWGDFKGDPDAMMEEWFDLHLYLANWGTHRLMMRVPKRLVDMRVVKACLVDSDFAKARVAGEHLILDIRLDELETDWDEGPGILASMAPLRADLLGGDQRLLYLVWLMAVEFELVSEDTPEPLPGLGPMTDALQAFAGFFCIDPGLIEAAAERDGVVGTDSISADAARETISGLSDREKIEFLSRLFERDPLASAELRAEVRNRLCDGSVTKQAPSRTAGELRARAEAIRDEREQEAARLEAEVQERLAREEDARRRERLLAVARRGEGVWRDVEAEIQRANATSYGRAVDWLLDLRAVAEERDVLPDFSRRLSEIRERHARKVRFLERIEDLV
ncbi:MAG: hypothetical protein ABSA58_24385 [Acetobacteraceae bacterium]|jgi:hypothetical protein